MTIGTIVTVIRMPHLGVGIIVDITKNGLCRVLFDEDDYIDNFAPLELDYAETLEGAA